MALKLVKEVNGDGGWQIVSGPWICETSELAIRQLRRRMRAIRPTQVERTKFKLYDSTGFLVLTTEWSPIAGWHDRGSWA